LAQALEDKNINLDKENCWIWKEGETFSYTIKFAYSIIEGEAEVEVILIYEDF